MDTEVEAATRDSALELLQHFHPINHAALLKVVADIPDVDLYQHHPHANSIAFNLWHVARWDDALAALLAETHVSIAERGVATRQVWHQGNWADRWGLRAGDLGASEAGTGMSEEAIAALRLGPREELLTYTRAAFAASDAMVAGLAAEELARPIRPGVDRTIARVAYYYWEHGARHLGMIEALIGVGGRKGSARG